MMYNVLVYKFGVIWGDIMRKQKIAAVFAVLAAVLYAINIPLSKLLLTHIEPTVLAGLLYLGAGLGMSVTEGIRRTREGHAERARLTKKDLPYTVAMVLLDIAAPILLMLGISRSNSANVSLMNNFEIVATTVVALVIFKETVSKRLWAAIALVTAASIVLSFEGMNSFEFNAGSLFVLGACVCWGFENNCTKMLSDKNPAEIVIIKGLCSGTGSMVIALVIGEHMPQLIYCAWALLLGFVAYGLSITFYIKAQKHFGAAKTSAFYSVAPFFGVIFSMILLGERPALQFYIALAMMIAATILLAKDTRRTVK